MLDHPCVLLVLLAVNDILNVRPCGGVTSHRMKLPGRMQVKVTVSPGQATGGVDISVAETIVCSSEHMYVRSV